MNPGWLPTWVRIWLPAWTDKIPASGLYMNPPPDLAGSCKQLQAFDWRRVDPGWHLDLGWQPTWVHVNGLLVT